MPSSALYADPVEVALPDGERVRLRRIRPEDAPRIRASVALLSPQTVYLRFFSSVGHLSDQQLKYLADVDGYDHVAIGAVARDEPDLPGIGLARYIRQPDAPRVAEVAATVLDAYQGRGLGSMLYAALSEVARENDVERFRVHVLAENADVLERLATIGGEVRSREGGIVEMDVPLLLDADALDELPDTHAYRHALRVLREAG